MSTHVQSQLNSYRCTHLRKDLYFIYECSFAWEILPHYFSIATTPRCKEGRYSIPWITLLYPYLIVLSAKQGCIKYHFLSLWYDSTWDWTQVSRTIDEHSTQLANNRLETYSCYSIFNSRGVAISFLVIFWFGLVWFGLILWHINHRRLFNTKSY